MLKKSMLGATLVTLALTVPAFAQSQIDNNQPVQGTLHSREISIQNKLNASYAAGVISSTQLAELQRDLDGILIKEDRQREKAGGQTDSNFDSISKALDGFEGKLDRHSNRVAASTVVPVDGAVTPITGNQSSIIQPAQQTYMVPEATTTIAAPATTTTQTTTVRTDSVIVPTP